MSTKNSILTNKVWTPSPKEIAAQKKWIKKQIKDIGETRLFKLAKTAAEIRKLAYQPYSKYSVGAAILGVSGNIYSSCNAEVVSYTETDHAERSTITQAIAAGELKKSGRKFIKAIAVSHPGKSGPCGGCRQRIAEHADNALVLDVDTKGNIQKITSTQILFPYAFTPSHLGIK
jgi:cytidine deaminase